MGKISPTAGTERRKGRSNKAGWGGGGHDVLRARSSYVLRSVLPLINEAMKALLHFKALGFFFSKVTVT